VSCCGLIIVGIALILLSVDTLIEFICCLALRPCLFTRGRVEVSLPAEIPLRVKGQALELSDGYSRASAANTGLGKLKAV
jgi:hypothetical protein